MLIEFELPGETWDALTQKVPPRLINDLGATTLSGLILDSDELVFTQYYAAVQRMIELLRPLNDEQAQPLAESRPAGTHDAPVGRYVHIDIGGQDYRIYYEEAGSGIPLVLHHTAGSNGVQWRHLFEMKEITDHFRLIAYDLPYHGKSIPPVGKNWWEEQYKLTGDFVRGLALGMVDALKLENPVFMGCSVGGVLALDLAYHHPGVFQHVISVEGALKVMNDTDDFAHRAFWHPQVSNEFKGRAMHAMTSPTAPEAYRRETIQGYQAGWPQAFLGDLHYYTHDYDLSMKAGEIDTSKTGVTILNGEYDLSGAIELGEVAAMLIKGSEHIPMDGLGHFPMSEDPVAFKKYVLPVLDRLRSKG